MEKTARQLLEEAASMIALPVIKVNGQSHSGWIQESELDGIWWGAKEACEVIDPTVVRAEGDAYASNGVCAIGAVALASLTSEGLSYKGEFISWDNQVKTNVEVALASVILGRRILMKQQPSPFASTLQMLKWGEYVYPHWVSVQEDTTYTINDAIELLMSPVETIVKKATTDPKLVTLAAQGLGQVITGYNDYRDRTYSEVADMFTEAIKDLIEDENSQE